MNKDILSQELENSLDDSFCIPNYWSENKITDFDSFYPNNYFEEKIQEDLFKNINSLNKKIAEIPTSFNTSDYLEFFQKQKNIINNNDVSSPGPCFFDKMKDIIQKTPKSSDIYNKINKNKFI